VAVAIAAARILYKKGAYKTGDLDPLKEG